MSLLGVAETRSAAEQSPAGAPTEQRTFNLVVLPPSARRNPRRITIYLIHAMVTAKKRIRGASCLGGSGFVGMGLRGTVIGKGGKESESGFS